MFVPRSVARKPGQSQTTAFFSKNTEHKASKTQRQAVVQDSLSQKHDNVATGSGLAGPTESDGGDRHDIQTVVYTDSSLQRGNDSPHRDEGSGLVAQAEHTNEGHESDSDVSEGSDEPVLSFSKQQRWPRPGEPVCVVCGRYGAYIVDRTDDDICSLECKAKRLMKLGIHLTLDTEGGADQPEDTDGDSSWVYREHPEVTSMSNAQCSALYKQVHLHCRWLYSYRKDHGPYMYFTSSSGSIV